MIPSPHPPIRPAPANDYGPIVRSPSILYGRRPAATARAHPVAVVSPDPRPPRPGGEIPRPPGHALAMDYGRIVGSRHCRDCPASATLSVGNMAVIRSWQATTLHQERGNLRRQWIMAILFGRRPYCTVVGLPRPPAPIQSPWRLLTHGSRDGNVMGC